MKHLVDASPACWLYCKHCRAGKSCMKNHDVGVGRNCRDFVERVK